MGKLDAFYGETAYIPTGNVVPQDSELDRVLSIPRQRRPPDLKEHLTAKYKTAEGTMALKQSQADCLQVGYDYGGGFFLLPCGEGKTLVTLLLPTVIGRLPFQGSLWLPNVLLLTKASLIEKTKKDIAFYKKHWKINDQMLTIMSYAKLGKDSGLLERKNYQVIMCDEAQALANPKAGRTRRILHYAKKNPNVFWFFLSGTIARRTIMDYQHLIGLACKHYSPLPHSRRKAESWSGAIDEGLPSNKRMHPGALVKLCAQGETVKKGYLRRLYDVPNVIKGSDESLDVNLEFYERKPRRIPDMVRDSFKLLHDKWQTPDNLEILEAKDYYAHASELSMGFFYRPVWPDGKPDPEWLEKRKEYGQFVRAYLSHNKRNLFTPGEVEKAILEFRKQCEASGQWHPDAMEPDSARLRGHPLAGKEYWRWQEVKERVQPRSEPVWLTYEMLEDASAFTGIIWTNHRAVGHKFSELSGIPYFGGGMHEIEQYQGTMIASISAHHEGKNLQYNHHANLVLTPFASASRWEQLIARTHRQGQKEDTVYFHLYLHCFNSWLNFWQARKNADHLALIGNGRQRLQYASTFISSEEEVKQRLQGDDPLWSA